LQDRQGKPNRPFAPIIMQCVGAIQIILSGGEAIIHGIGKALREEAGAIELAELLFDQVAHDIRDIHFMDAITEATLEAILIEQRHKELEILFLAIMRSRRQ
jgi:hypothetical protein